MAVTSQSGFPDGQRFDHLRPDRDPDVLIGRDGDTYLQRWWLIPRNRAFNVYYHRILQSDDDRALHDHPWPSLSILVCGVLREVTREGERLIMPGQCVYRAPKMAHRLELVGDDPVETLFITGPWVRDWGFHCPSGWVHWKDFVGDNSGEVGRGCGETE